MYNPEETQRLLQAVEWHQRLPSGDYINLLIAQLKAAEEAIAEAAGEVRDSVEEAAKAKRDLQTEEKQHKATRERLKALEKNGTAPAAVKPKKVKNAAIDAV
jgi:hypothetical protein